MKKLPVLVLASLCLWISQTVHAEPVVIKLSHVVNENTPKGIAARYFARLVNQRLEGEVTVEVYPDAKLYDDHDAIKAVQGEAGKQGLMIVPSMSKLQDEAPALGIFDIPGMFNGMADVNKLTKSPVADEVVKQLKDDGLQPMAFWHNGMRVLSIRGSQNPVASGPNFSGKQFRIEDSTLQSDFISSLGGEAKVMDFSEVENALRGQGVDGQTNTWSNIYTKELYKYQDYIVEPGFTYLGYIVLLNKEFWDGLDPLIQRQIQWALGEATHIEHQLAADINAQHRDMIMRDGNIKVVALAADQQSQWLRDAEAIEARYRDKIGAELLEQVHTLLGH
ncbi:MAG: DctP family TRAP transporter solute-binding subunit [bacterium]